MMTQMQEMMANMMRTNNNNNSSRTSHGRGRGRGRGRDNGTNRGHGNRNTNARTYCWSHGACAHTGADCNTPATGHQTAATFTNMMGGSTNGCCWVAWQVGTTDSINIINENLYCNTVVVPPPSHVLSSRFASPNAYAILDSGATGTFVTASDAQHLLDTSIIDNGPTVLSASGMEMPTTIKGHLPLSPALSVAAQSAFVLDDLKTGTLISLSQLCDDNCIAIFTQYDVQILKSDNVIIKGTRMSNGLWSLPINKQATLVQQVNGILRTDKPKQELATYLHATLGSPAPSTLLRAIRRGHLTTIPSLTTNLIAKHLPESIATVLGHQDQEAKSLRSTRNPSTSLQHELLMTPFDYDLAPPLEETHHHICAMLLDKQDFLKLYSD
jgi:hypothetical protein